MLSASRGISAKGSLKDRSFPYLSAMGITVLILMLIYLFKGIFPFGTGTISWGDMYENYTTAYYYIHDVFHSGEGLFFNFASGGGANFWGVFTFTLMSPFNLIALLFSRENVIYATGIILVFKMAFITFTSYYFLNKVFPTLERFYKTALSVMTAFSGYVLILHTNIMWLDAVILFPLLLLSLRKLFDEGKILNYIIIMTANLYICYYISYMLLLFVFFGSIAYLMCYVKKSQRGERVVKLGVATVTSLLLAAPVVLPNLIQATASVRMKTDLGSILFDGALSNLFDKMSFFFPAAFLLVICLYAFIHRKNSKNFMKFSGLLLMLTMVQVVVNPINKLWHTGYYASFPYRYGFIPLFILVIIAAYYLNKSSATTSPLQNKKMTLTPMAVGVGCVLVAVGLAYVARGRIQEIIFSLTLHRDITSFIILGVMALLFIIAYFMVFRYAGRARIGYIVLAAVMAIEIFTNASLYIGMQDNFDSIREQNYNAAQLGEILPDSDEYIRVKDKNEILNYNASMIYGENSLSQFSSLTGKDYMETLKKLGYSSVWTISSSVGGTLFTDSLLSHKYIFSDEELPSDLYTPYGTSENYTVYENPFFMPQGLVLDSTQISKLVLDENRTIFDNQNDIYAALSGTSDSLFTTYNPQVEGISVTPSEGVVNYTLLDSETPGEINFNINIVGRQNAYLDIVYSFVNEENTEILNELEVTVNGERIVSENRLNSDNGYGYFPSTYNNGLLDLGVYQDETLTVSIKVSEDFTAREVLVGSMDISKLESLSSVYNQTDVKTAINGDSLTVTAKSQQDGEQLFLSLPYDSGLSCTVNGKSVPITKTLGAMSSVPLEVGENTVIFRYSPPGFSTGMTVSIITLLGVIAISILSRKKKIVIPQRICSVVNKVYLFGYLTMFVIFYIIPFVTFLVAAVGIII